MIDDRVRQGTAYGFEIGSTKRAAFEEATKSLQDQSAYLRNAMTGRMAGPIAFSQDDWQVLEQQDEWEFFLEGDSLDLIALKFTDGRVAEIWRYRLPFELP